MKINWNRFKYWKHFPKLNWRGYKKDLVLGPLLLSWGSYYRYLRMEIKSVREDLVGRDGTFSKKAVIYFHFTICPFTVILMLPRPAWGLKHRVPKSYSFTVGETDISFYWPKKGYDVEEEPDEYDLGEGSHYASFTYFWLLTRAYHQDIYRVQNNIANLITRDRGGNLLLSKSGCEEDFHRVQVLFGIGQDKSDGEWIPFGFTVSRSIWERGDRRWFRWMSYVFKPFVRQYVNFWFVKETGSKKGSWKGGTLGCSLEFTCYDSYKDDFIDLKAVHIAQFDKKDKLSHLKLHKSHQSLVSELLDQHGYLENVIFTGSCEFKTNRLSYYLSDEEVWLEDMAKHKDLNKAPIPAQKAVIDTFRKKKEIWNKRAAKEAQDEPHKCSS